MKTSIQDIEFNGLKAIQLSLDNGSTAIVSQQGGQVLSWKARDGRERLFLSQKAVFDGSKAIRGGVPVCFPQFSNLGSLPKHGLLRTREWIEDSRRCAGDYAMVCLACEDDEASRALWPHAFRAELTVVLEGNRLDVELAVENRGDSALQFTAALHTYLTVSDIEDAQLAGLHGVEYRDAAQENRHHQQRGEALEIEGEVDRVYHDVPRSLLMADGVGRLGLNQENFPDTVVWNPGKEAIANFADLEAGEYRKFLCVEAAAARQPVTLRSGDSWWGRQSLAAVYD